MLGICGACLERAGCVLLFAILYLLITISNILSVIVGLATWDYDGDVTIRIRDEDKDEEELVLVNGVGGAFIPGFPIYCSHTKAI